jgi:acetyl-CoA carboxylase carboxyltransferase component
MHESSRIRTATGHRGRRTVCDTGAGLGTDREAAADACLAWPTAEICAMSIEGAIDVAFRKEYQSAPDPTKRNRAFSRPSAIRAQS